MKWLAVVLASGCAVTTTTCPVGSRLTVTRGTTGRAQYCALEDMSRGNVPDPGFTSEGATRPVEMRGVADGPFTAWHGNGVKAAHGAYRAIGARAVPDGLWAFWYPDAHLELVGRYVKGVPVGCFETWDERGVPHTGVMTGDATQEQSCTPPSVAELDEPVADTAARGDATFAAFAGPNGIGATTSGQASSHAMTLAFAGSVRMYFGRLRVGPFASVRTGDDTGDIAYAGGVGAAWRLPAFHPRIDSEVGIELGGERIRVAPQRPAETANPLVFYSVLPALQATLAIALTPVLSAIVGARVDGIPSFGVQATSSYIGRMPETLTETWRVGGINAGVTFGIRLAL